MVGFMGLSIMHFAAQVNGSEKLFKDFMKLLDRFLKN